MDKQPKTDAELSTPHFQHPQPQSQSNPASDQVVKGTPDFSALTQQVEELTRRFNDKDNKRINFNTDLIGLFQTVSAAPTGVPVSPYEQVKIYVNSTTYRLYWYDSVGHVWHYVTATA